MKLYVALLFLISFSIQAQEKVDTLSLFFDNDVFELKSIQKIKIDSIDQDTSNLVSVVIKGFTNDFASEKYNQKLSERRVSSVKNQFKHLQITEAKGLGEMPSSSPFERRVDIITTRSLPIPKIAEKTPAAANSLDIQMQQATVGDKIILKEIQFLPGVDILRDFSQPVIVELLTLMRENPLLKIKINGHVCCGRNGRPSSIDGMNNRTRKQNLSEARAKVIFEYLIDNGIEPQRLTYEGMAFKFPLGKGDNADRRVEIEIISKE